MRSVWGQLISHHREAGSDRTGAGGCDCGVERQEVGFAGDLIDGLGDFGKGGEGLLNRAHGGLQALHFSGPGFGGTPRLVDGNLTRVRVGGVTIGHAGAQHD